MSVATSAVKRRKRARVDRWAYVFAAPFLISYGLFQLYPMLYSLYISFTNWTATSMDQRDFVGADNYIRVITGDTLFRRALFNTVRLMVMFIPAVIVSGLLIAVLLHSLYRSRQFFQTVNFLPYITTPVAIGLMFAYLFDWNIGPVNGILSALGLIGDNINWLGSKAYAPVVVALMCVWKNFGYFMVLYLSGLSTISDDYYEAARVDGANAVQAFFKITLPLLRPITVFVVINSMIGGLQLFDEAVQVIAGSGSNVVGGPERSVLTVVWYFYDISFKNNSRYGYGAAVAFTLFLIIAIVSLVNVKILNRKED